MLFGADVSHYQGTPQFPSVRAAGLSFVFLKATEGTNYVDPTYATNRDNAHTAGLTVGSYHFARATDPVSEAAFFLRTVGAVRPGELLALDWEVATGNPVSWCRTFLDAVKAQTGVAPLLYINQSTLNGYNWGGVAQTYGLWLAKYDNSTVAVPVKDWSVLAVKQYWDKGSVAGISGGVDVDVFYGDAAALAQYAAPGAAPAPAPVPAPPAPAPAPPAPSFDVRAWRCAQGATGQVFVDLQNWLNRNYPAYSHIAPVAPVYGPQTVNVLRQFQARVGIRGGDGTNIGPQTALALYNAGFRG